MREVDKEPYEDGCRCRETMACGILWPSRMTCISRVAGVLDYPDNRKCNVLSEIVFKCNSTFCLLVDIPTCSYVMACQFSLLRRGRDFTSSIRYTRAGFVTKYEARYK